MWIHNKINYAFFKFHFEHDRQNKYDNKNDMHTHTCGQKEIFSFWILNELTNVVKFCYMACYRNVYGAE